LGWAIGKTVSTRKWIIRSILLALLLCLLFIPPVIDWLSGILLKTNSSILFPNANLGLYQGVLDKYLNRTVYTNTQNFAVVVWWIIALLVAFFQKDKTTLITGILIGGGFGIGFMQSAVWTIGYRIAPDYIDWWKIWELNSGFNLGLIYAVVWYWSVHKNSEISFSENKDRTKFNGWSDTIFLAFAGFILLFFVGFEYFLWTGIALSLFYFIVTCLTLTGIIKPGIIAEQQKDISLTFSIFFLVFILFQGASERMGIVFNLFSLDEDSQYSWPVNRILLFLPIALVITVVAVFRMWRIFRFGSPQNQNDFWFSKQSMRIIDLMTILGFIGAISIWPSKISAFYAFFLVLAISAFNRLEYHFNRTNISKNQN
jgi:hypothetical protein